MKQIKIYKLKSVNESEHSGTIYDPYTWTEFIQLLDKGDWIGGYVEGRGYIPQYVSVVGSSIMVIDGISGYSSYYPYWFFLPVNETLHHTHSNGDGSETTLTDINIKASINLYVMTIKVNITQKGNCYVSNPSVYLDVENCPHESSRNLMNQTNGDSIFSSEVTINLPVDSLPSISLEFYCDYDLNGNPGSDSKSLTIYPQD